MMLSSLKLTSWFSWLSDFCVVKVGGRGGPDFCTTINDLGRWFCLLLFVIVAGSLMKRRACVLPCVFTGELDAVELADDEYKLGWKRELDDEDSSK